MKSIGNLTSELTEKSRKTYKQIKKEKVRAVKFLILDLLESISGNIDISELKNSKNIIII